MATLGRTILILSILTTVIGCNEEQLTRADRIIADVNDIAAGGSAVLQSPAGELIPQPARAIAQLVIGLLMAGVITWEEWRNRIMTKTTKAIVKGIEAADKAGQVNPTNPVKTAIAEQMKQAGIYSQADDLVNKLKVMR